MSRYLTSLFKGTKRVNFHEIHLSVVSSYFPLNIHYLLIIVEYISTGPALLLISPGILLLKSYSKLLFAATPKHLGAKG